METHENSPTGVETSSQTEAIDLLGFVNSETTTKHDESSEMCLFAINLRFFMLLLPKTLFFIYGGLRLRLRIRPRMRTASVKALQLWWITNNDYE